LNFGQSILIQIIEIAATRWQTLKLKCTELDFGWGSAPDQLGELTALPQTLSWILWRKEGEGRKGMGRKERVE